MGRTHKNHWVQILSLCRTLQESHYVLQSIVMFSLDFSVLYYWDPDFPAHSRNVEPCSSFKELSRVARKWIASCEKNGFKCPSVDLVRISSQIDLWTRGQVKHKRETDVFLFFCNYLVVKSEVIAFYEFFLPFLQGTWIKVVWHSGLSKPVITHTNRIFYYSYEKEKTIRFLL